MGQMSVSKHESLASLKQENSILNFNVDAIHVIDKSEDSLVSSGVSHEVRFNHIFNPQKSSLLFGNLRFCFKHRTVNIILFLKEICGAVVLKHLVGLYCFMGNSVQVCVVL